MPYFISHAGLSYGLSVLLQRLPHCKPARIVFTEAFDVTSPPHKSHSCSPRDQDKRTTQSSSRAPPTEDRRAPEAYAICRSKRAGELG